MMYLYVKAQGKLMEKSYDDAVRILVRIRRIEQNDDRREVTLADLGMAYYGQGKMQEAYTSMAEAYDLFQERGSRSSKEKHYRDRYRRFIMEYKDLLHKMGRDEEAETIERNCL
ncbi:MAG: hypothetical protein ACYC99_05580 [Candidatus Geothermincolia bacterium]